ncbi:hypothetical protein L218DRAFT_117621 [Marasmius fiardii PR-910]|nr:hypothetical protein L218DRAFT_117621 [Marasmius fiardii PR-910]
MDYNQSIRYSFPRSNGTGLTDLSSFTPFASRRLSSYRSHHAQPVIRRNQYTRTTLSTHHVKATHSRYFRFPTHDTSQVFVSQAGLVLVHSHTVFLALPLTSSRRVCGCDHQCQLPPFYTERVTHTLFSCSSIVPLNCEMVGTCRGSLHCPGCLQIGHMDLSSDRDFDKDQ